MYPYQIRCNDLQNFKFINSVNYYSFSIPNFKILLFNIKYKFAPLLSLLIFQGVGVQKFTKDVPKLSFRNWVNQFMSVLATANI